MRYNTSSFLSRSRIDCCGCGVCEVVCAAGAIKLRESEEGFMVPELDEAACTGCEACSKCCPTLQTPKMYAPMNCFYGWHREESSRMESTSGGLSRAIVEAFFARYKKAVIVGAEWLSDFSVAHKEKYKLSDCAPFFRSKYIQSRTTEIFESVRNHLRADIPVLFTGTPCQVHALHVFLGRPYDRLFCVDLVCHGVGSPGVFKRYIKENARKYKKELISFSFRNKVIIKNELCHNAIRIDFNDGSHILKKKDLFFRGFQDAVLNRASCQACLFSCRERAGDYTLGDFWGIEKRYPSLSGEKEKGISMLLVNTKKGIELLEDVETQAYIWETSMEYSLSEQLVKPMQPRFDRDRFFRLAQKLPIRKVLVKAYPWKENIHFFFPRAAKRVSFMVKKLRTIREGTSRCK